ncbi:hypothetical protein QFZ35_002573 [Arthrobacter ulcerisalmonis]|nr:hypothetical protein [Arthrobacter ulcerisalmonis]
MRPARPAGLRFPLRQAERCKVDKMPDPLKAGNDRPSIGMPEHQRLGPAGIDCVLHCRCVGRKGAPVKKRDTNVSPPR